jgi:predicted aspartyl protease
MPRGSRRTSFAVAWAILPGACLLLLACCGKSAGQRGAIKVPLTRDPNSGLLTLQAHVNGRAITMAVDTGANTTLFTNRLLDEIQLEAGQAPKEVEHLGTRLPLKSAHVNEWRVGDWSTQLDALFLDLEGNVQGLSNPGELKIDGLVGMDWLNRWAAVIDCKEGVLLIRNPAGSSH